MKIRILNILKTYFIYTLASDGALMLLIVVGSHIQRVVPAAEETTVTSGVSHRPIKCLSRSWSQRCTKVNGSHHGDNPLLKPTGVHIAMSNQPRTSETYRRQDVFGHELHFLLS